MIGAGLPMVQCLEILAGQLDSPEFRKIANRIKEDVQSGDLFYWPPGHTVKVNENVEFVLFSPQNEHTPVMDHINKKLNA